MNKRGSFAPALLLLGVSASVAAGFVAIARNVRKHRTRRVDAQARKHVLARRRKPATLVARAIGPVGKWWAYVPATLPAAGFAWRRGRAGVPGAAAIVASAAAAATMEKVFDHGLRQRKPPPGRHSPTTQSFPSGHTMGPAAVVLTAAYVLVREDLADARVAVPVAVLVPVLSGMGRLYLDRHWASDVAGGWLAGLSVAAGCAAAYELAREEQRSRWR